MHIEQDVVRLQRFTEHKLAGIGGIQTLELRGIHALDEGNRIGLVSRQDGNTVFRQIRIDAAQGHVFRVPVVGVLFKYGNVIHRETGHAEGAGADVGLRIHRHAPSESAKSTFTG